MSFGSVDIKLHPGQLKVFGDPHRFRVLCAGRRFGKTVLARTELISWAKKKDQLIWYVTPTYRMARQILWHEIIDALPRKWIKSLNNTRLEIELVNGSRIELKGADKPDGLRGVGINFIVLDEAQDIKPDTWYKVLRPTLSSTGGHALFIGTPKSFNWFYDLYMLGQRGEVVRTRKGTTFRNVWSSWQFPTIMSPFIPASEIVAARQDLDEKTFRQEYEASFEAMSGRVYYGFDRNVHLGDFELNPNLPIWVGQDFNIDPMSSVIMQYVDNKIYVFDELIMYGSNTQETAEELSRRYWRHLNKIVFYPDPAGANRSHTRGESDLDILRDAGFRRMKYRRKHPKVADRVNAVNRMLQSADGQIRLFVDRRCKNLIDALEQTIYKPNSREVDKSMGIEHPADALGYGVELEFPVRKVRVAGTSI